MDNLIIRASAGTGKTYQLARRYLQLLLSGERPECILATTFTKKAAGEIQNRILSWLAAGAVDEAGCKELLEKLNLVRREEGGGRRDAKRSSKGNKSYEFTNPCGSTSTPHSSLLTPNLSFVRDTLYRVIKNLHRLNISTLDSFFNQRAQCFSLELGLPMDWTIMDESKDQRIRYAVASTMLADDEVVKRFVQFISKGETKRAVVDSVISTVGQLYTLWREAPPEAWDALEVPKIPCDESGFQKLLNETLDRLSQITTLTDKQKSDTISSVDRLRNPATRYDESVYLLTHALGQNTAAIVNSPASGIAVGKRVIDEPATVDCMIQIVLYAQAYIKQVWKLHSDFQRDMLSTFDDLYMKAKKSAGSLIFEDIPWLLSQKDFLNRQINPAFRMDGAIRHLMLDEFQDTNLAQWRVLEGLAKKCSGRSEKRVKLGVRSEEGGVDAKRSSNVIEDNEFTASCGSTKLLTPHSSLLTSNASSLSTSFFCVGDDKQAIYGWRGGESELLNSMTSLLKPAKIELKNMSHSFRSGEAIMTAVNDVFENIGKNQLLISSSKGPDAPQPLHTACISWMKRFQKHETAKTFPSYVEMTVAGLVRNEELEVRSDAKRSSEGGKNKEFTNPCGNTSTPHSSLLTPNYTPTPHSSLLTPNLSDDTDSRRDRLYSYSAQRIKELYEQSAEHGFTIGVLTRSNEAANEMAVKIKELGLECSEEGKSPLLDSYEVCLILALMKWIDHPGDTYSQYKVCQSTLAKTIGLNRDTILFDNQGRLTDGACNYQLLNEIRYSLLHDGYGAVVERWAEALKPEASPRSQRRLEKLEELANKYQPEGSTRTDDFVEYIEKAPMQDALKCRIRIMSYHQSKGLEFDIVVLPELDKPVVQYLPEPVIAGRPTPIDPPDEIIRYVNSELRFLLPREQQDLFIRHTERQMQEALCNLYVAMTRAARGLYMFLLPPKSNGRSGPSKTYEDVLMGTLAPGESKQEGVTMYTTGDPHWIENTAKKEIENGKLKIENYAKRSSERIGSTDITPHSSLLTPNYSALPASAWTTNVKPSSFIDVVTVSASCPQSETLSESQRGTLFHTWLADIESVSTYKGTDDRLNDLGCGIGLQKESFALYLSTFKTLLRQPNLQKTLTQLDDSWQTYREKNVAGILTSEDEPDMPYLVSGVIDRLTVHRTGGRVDKAIILDYKTVPTGSKKDHIRTRYAGQMDAYRQIVSNMYKIPLVKIQTTLMVIEV